MSSCVGIKYQGPHLTPDTAWPVIGANLATVHTTASSRALKGADTGTSSAAKQGAHQQSSRAVPRTQRLFIIRG